MVTVIESPNCAKVPGLPVNFAWTFRIGSTHPGCVAGAAAAAGTGAAAAPAAVGLSRPQSSGRANRQMTRRGRSVQHMQGLPHSHTGHVSGSLSPPRITANEMKTKMKTKKIQEGVGTKINADYAD